MKRAEAASYGAMFLAFFLMLLHGGFSGANAIALLGTGFAALVFLSEVAGFRRFSSASVSDRERERTPAMHA